MIKYLPSLLIFVCLSGCISKTRTHPKTEFMFSPEQFSAADINKDDVIDRNESALFTKASTAPNYITPLIVISSIVALIVVCCSCSSVSFFFKSKYLRLKDLLFKK